MEKRPNRGKSRIDIDIDTSRARRTAPSGECGFGEGETFLSVPPRGGAGQRRTVNAAGARRPPETAQQRMQRQEAARRAAAARKKRERQRRKRRVRRALLAVLLVVLVTPLAVFGGFYAYVQHSLSGENAGMGTLDKEIATAKEFEGDVVNVLLCGIDYEEGRTHKLTDMIMYVNFDVKNKRINMLQIPRDTFVGGEYSGNGKINGVASYGGELDISLLANRINQMFRLPIDYYATIDMQSLKSIVDTFGGIEVYVPREMEYKGSVLHPGYQTMNGDAAEFFVRCRHGAGFETGDFARLEMQRYFYSGLINRLRSMTPKDVAKLFPVFMTYMKTDIPVSEMVGIGLSVLKVPSQNIMMCRVPEYAGAEYYLGQHAVNVVARTETAQLLNDYFRSYGQPVDESELLLPQFAAAGGLHDAAIKYMGAVDSEGGITSGNFGDGAQSEPAA